MILVDGALGDRVHAGGRELAAELRRDFVAVAYDRRGRGESGDTPPYAVAREIEVVGAPVGLYGFSSGAVLSLHAAAALGV